METVRLIWLGTDVVRRDLNTALACCSEGDLRQVRRFVQEEDRLLSLAGIWLIRHFVGPAEAISFGPGGKPLADHVCFNLSHSGRMAALALADRPVGLDIEKEIPPDPDLAAFCLSRAEQQSGAGLTALFTSKEALAKADGSGLPDDLSSVPALPLDGDVFWRGRSYHRNHFRRGTYELSICLEDSSFSLREEFIHASQ